MTASPRPTVAIPAIDIRDGQVVRLKQGDYDQQTTYSFDPLQRAEDYHRSGAEILHLVDLDAARAGGFTLGPLIGRVVAATGMTIQTGGGVRSRADVQTILDAGADRVVIGSVAIKDPETVLGWLEVFGPERLTIALDTRQDEQGVWRLPAAGWTEATGAELFALCERYAAAGMVHLLCTDISRDGMLTGPNVELYRELASRFPDVAVQASGGVQGLEDIVDCAAAGAGGVILGKALLDGRFSLAEAIATARGED